MAVICSNNENGALKDINRCLEPFKRFHKHWNEENMNQYPFVIDISLGMKINYNQSDLKHNFLSCFDVTGIGNYNEYGPNFIQQLYDIYVKKMSALVFLKTNLSGATTLPPIIKTAAVKSYGLMHVFWGKIDSTKDLTKTNCKMWAETYNISRHTLLQAFSDQYEKKDREPDQKMIDNKKYLNPYLKRFKDALKMLEPLSKEAYDYGTKELNSLKERYDIS